MRARIQTRYVTSPKLVIYTGFNNYALGADQETQDIEAIKLINTQPKWVAIAKAEGFTIREYAQSAHWRKISATTFNAFNNLHITGI